MYVTVIVIRIIYILFFDLTANVNEIISGSSMWIWCNKSATRHFVFTRQKTGEKWENKGTYTLLSGLLENTPLGWFKNTRRG
jgi:hypothetical protein